MFMYRELQNQNSHREWLSTKAKSIDGAKRAAKRAQMFQNTVLEVGIWHAGGRVSRHAVYDGKQWADSFDQDCV